MVNEVLIDGNVVDETELLDILAARAILDKNIKGRTERELAELERRKSAILAFMESGQFALDTPKAKSETPSAPKYQDPTTGKTWSGKGKRPGWFDPDRADYFLIQKVTVADAPVPDTTF